MTTVNAGATEKIIMLVQELVSEAKSGNEKCWKRLLLSLPCQTKNAVVKLKCPQLSPHVERGKTISKLY